MTYSLAAALKGFSEQETPEWGEPRSLIAQTAADPYPLAVLPGGIGAAVREVAAFVQSPVPMAACSALATLSAAAQALADVRRDDGLVGPVSAWWLLIAESGERKSSTDDKFNRPIREWEAAQAGLSKPELAKYSAAIQAWSAKREGILAAIKNLAKQAKPTARLEDELAQLEAAKPLPPKVPRLLYQDSTPEKTAWSLAHEWPSGTIMSSEAGVILGGAGMGSDSAMRNMALQNVQWDGGSLRIDRRTSESFTVRGTRLTLGYSVQMDALQSFHTATKGLARGIGYYARFLMAWPESTQGVRLFKSPPAAWPALSAFHRRIADLLEIQPNINQRGELEPPILDLSAPAKAAWIEFHDEVERELRPGGDLREACDVAAKAADNAARLAALFHLFEHGPTGAIGVDHLQAAASIVTWHLYEARRFFGEMALSPTLAAAIKLDSWLLRHCREKHVTSVSTRKVQQLGPNQLRDKRALESAVLELEESDRARLIQDGHQKRIEINPALLGDRHGAA